MSEVVARQPNTAARAAWICLVIAWITFLLPVPFIGMLGWALNLVAFVLAIVAMSKGGAMAGLFQLLASLLVSPFVYLIGVILFIGTMDGAPDWSEMVRDHGAFSSSGNNTAEEANRAAADADIAAIEAAADAASGAPASQVSVAAPVSASTR